jgi:type IV secretion system protein VirB9
MRTATIACLAALLAGPVLAERAPVTMGQDARVRHVRYDASDVIRVDTHLRVNTAVELGAGERINQVLLGDSESFEVEVLSNRQTVSIKPVVPRVSTNMTIYTDRRAIAFALTEGHGRRPTFRVVVNFPEDRAPRPQLVAGGRDLGYRFAEGEGVEEIRPLQVWNDGRSTFFQFRPGVRPAIFGVNGAGYEVTQNSTTRGTVVRVSGVRDAYTVRVGEAYVCITRGGTSYATGPAADALRSREF